MDVTKRSRGWVFALAGPAAAGAAAGFRSGVGEVVQLGFAMPALAAGVAVLTLPALYVATTYTGAAPQLDRLATGIALALRDAGLAMLGFAPVLLFLGATSTPELSHAWAFVACAAAGFVAVRTLAHDAVVTNPRSVSQRAVFAAWALLTAGIGAAFVAHLLFSDLT